VKSRPWKAHGACSSKVVEKRENRGRHWLLGSLIFGAFVSKYSEGIGGLQGGNNRRPAEGAGRKPPRSGEGKQHVFRGRGLVGDAKSWKKVRRNASTGRKEKRCSIGEIRELERAWAAGVCGHPVQGENISRKEPTKERFNERERHKGRSIH